MTTTLRRLGYAALTVAFLHVVFGAIVRISGSGMGCGDHWPKCYGYWFPPFSRPDLVIEVLHRYFAAALITVVLALLAVALVRRREPGVAGRGGVLRSAALAFALVTFAAGFGAVTVRFANAPWATVIHKGIAAALLATLAAAVIRAGGFGGARAAAAPTSGRTARASYVAAGLAITAVLLGGLTAKIAGAAVACRGFPLCGEGSLGGGAQHVQLTHRVVAYLLALHLIGLAVAVTRRREAGPVAATARLAGGVVVLQIALGAAMVLGGFYPVLRSLHQATGITLWLATFVMAYLARRGSRPGAPAPLAGHPTPPRPRTVPAPAGTAIGADGARLGAPRALAAGGAGDTAHAAIDDLGALERAVANGDVVRAGPVAHRLGRTPPALPRVSGGPALVLHDEPLRRGRGRDGRRGRDTAARPFRVIDGRVRPAAAGLAALAAHRLVELPAHPGQSALPPATATAPHALLAGDAGELVFDLAHAGPEFTIVVWSAERRAASGEVRTSAPATTVERPAGSHLFRRFAAAFDGAVSAEPARAAMPDESAAAMPDESAAVVAAAPDESTHAAAAVPPAAVPGAVLGDADIDALLAEWEATVPTWAEEPRALEPPVVAADAAAVEALLGTMAAPSVAAVRRARRYSVAVLVARGADV